MIVSIKFSGILRYIHKLFNLGTGTNLGEEKTLSSNL